MQNKAEMLLDNEMVPYIVEQFDKGCIGYITEQLVLDNGDIITRITFDGCDPFVGNYIFHAGAQYYRQTLKIKSNENHH
jgi:hypothetical protein